MPVIIDSGVPASRTKTSFVLWDDLMSRPSGSFFVLDDDPAYPGENAIDPATYNTWRGTGAATRITRTLPATRSADCIGICGHNLATSGASVRAWYSTDGGTNWVAACNLHSPLTNEDLIIMFPQVTGNAFRITITDGPANVAVAMMGKATQFPHPPIDSYTPLHHARRYTKLYNRSMTGQLLSNRVMGAGAETDIDFGFVDRSFVDGPMRGFEDHYNRGGTFFFASWPAGKPQDMGYCWAPEEDSIVSVEYIEADKLANVSFSVASYVGVK